jgi:polar amino acid transport system substrate-binding protein
MSTVRRVRRLPPIVAVLLACMAMIRAQAEPPAPAGKLRVAVFPPQYTKDSATGRPQGWPIELGRALAAHLEAEPVLVEYAGPHKVLDDIKIGACDIAFLPIEPTWAETIDYSPPFLQIDFTLLVPAGSSIRRMADADRDGVRIAVVRNHASTLALSRTLKDAETVAAESPDAAFELLRERRADAMASVRPALLDYAARLPGATALDDRYGANILAVVVRKGERDRLAKVTSFIEAAKASGLVQRAIEHAGWRGVQVAPAANSN